MVLLQFVLGTLFYLLFDIFSQYANNLIALIQQKPQVSIHVYRYTVQCHTLSDRNVFTGVNKNIPKSLEARGD